MSQADTDTLVVGAGPYGLSISAHLRGAGVSHRVFGETMAFWSRGMPKGMCLRSSARASSLSDPKGALTIEAFAVEQGVSIGPPLPIESFIAYGHWFAERAGVEVDSRLVDDLSVANGVFVASLDDGEEVRSHRVVLAAGSEPFQWTPPEFRGLPPNLVSHTSDHNDLSVFAGKELLVLGAGQAGVEYAAIASEQGANVRLVLRRPSVRWLTRSAKLHDIALLKTLLYAPSDVGPAGLSRVVSAPGLFRVLPSTLRDKSTRRCSRPAAASWLVERTQNIPFETGRGIRSVGDNDGRVRIVFDGGSELEADHLILATGYKVDLGNYGFLAPQLLATIRTADGFPVLGPGFTSSVRGLHIVGWPATGSYGPLMRHVVGTEYAGKALATRLAAHKIRTPPPRIATVDA